MEEIVTTNANGDSCDIYYNIQLDPLFVNLANGDYQLLDDSPCIDAGNPIPEYNDGCFPPGLGNITNDMGVFGGLWNCGWLEPLNNIPEVSNVVFSQAVDGSRHLNIIYDVYDATNDIMEISVFVSFDSGSSWEECQNVSGDVGAGQVSGMNKQIEWDFGSQFPNIFSNNAIIKVEADNGN